MSGTSPSKEKFCSIIGEIVDKTCGIIVDPEEAREYDAVELTVLPQSIGFRLNSFEFESVPNLDSNGIEIEIRCKHSGMTSKLLLNSQKCTCPERNQNSERNDSYWEIRGGGPQTPVSGFKGIVKDTSCELLPDISRKSVNISRTTLAMLLQNYQNDLAPDTNRDKTIDASRMISLPPITEKGAPLQKSQSDNNLYPTNYNRLGSASPANGTSEYYINGDKIAQLIALLGKREFPDDHPNFRNHVVELLKKKFPLGVTLLRTTSEELVSSRDGISSDRKKCFHSCMALCMPEVIDVLGKYLAISVCRLNGTDLNLIPSNLVYMSLQASLPSDNRISISTIELLVCVQHLFSWIFGTALQNEKTRLSSLYGAIAGLSELGSEVIKVFIIPRLKSISDRIELHLQGTAVSNTDKITAGHIRAMLQKCCAPVLKTMRNPPDVVDEYKRDYGFLGPTLHQEVFICIVSIGFLQPVK